MALLNAWTAFRIESAPVILHGEKESLAIKMSSDRYFLCVSMADGILDQFTYDPEEGVCGVVGQAFARDI